MFQPRWLRQVLAVCGLGIAVSSPMQAEMAEGDIAKGGMDSGGGELIGHTHNPWFLETKRAAPVRYCVRVGADFVQTEDALARLVQQSLDFWRNEFDSAYLPVNYAALEGDVPSGKFKLRVKTTGFVHERCNDTTDLAIQFGELTPEQRKTYFDDMHILPASFVGVSVRTDYDMKNMRARGFIYISPDRGPQRFVGEGLLENAWTVDENTRLQRTLIHELGHVFGLQHQGGRYDLMGAAFPQALVTEKYGPATSKRLNFFYPTFGDVYKDCAKNTEMNPVMRAFFKIPNEHLCVHVSIQPEGLKVYSRIADDLPWQTVGQAIFADLGQRRYQQAVDVWLPVEQSKFVGVPAGVRFLKGAAIVQAQYTGIYRVNGEERPIFVQLDAASFQLGGVLDGRMIPDVLPANYLGRPSGWQPAANP